MCCDTSGPQKQTTEQVSFILSHQSSIHLNFVSTNWVSDVFRGRNNNSFVARSLRKHLCQCLKPSNRTALKTFIMASTTPLKQNIKILSQGGVTSALGFLAGGMTAGLKSSGQPDLAIILSEQHSSVAGVFTQSYVKAAPVILCQNFLAESNGTCKCIIINSGQANAATGEKGFEDAQKIVSFLASQLPSTLTNEVLMASTGVIGTRINVPLVQQSIPSLVERAGKTSSHGLEAAHAIMTTDLVPKHIAVQWNCFGRKVTLGGMAKGSGMIHPNMATMLGFITTDIEIQPSILQYFLKRAVSKTFNMISVDGDTSTNDTVLIMANGMSQVTLDSSMIHSNEANLFEEALITCCEYLAKAIARDGEGATCLLQVEVNGTNDNESAQRIARAVASSTLWKAAVFGRDPNWGRIIAAAGAAGVPFEIKELSVRLGNFELMKNGLPLQFDKLVVSNYMKSAAQARYMSGDDQINVCVQVGKGQGVGVAWGCDLSYDYVKINAEYTT
eukprot:jgi/Galph1/822/GphlegSOOS_G5548.1